MWKKAFLVIVVLALLLVQVGSVAAGCERYYNGQILAWQGRLWRVSADGWNPSYPQPYVELCSGEYGAARLCSFDSKALGNGKLWLISTTEAEKEGWHYVRMWEKPTLKERVLYAPLWMAAYPYETQGEMDIEFFAPHGAQYVVWREQDNPGDTICPDGWRGWTHTPGLWGCFWDFDWYYYNRPSFHCIGWFPGSDHAAFYTDHWQCNGSCRWVRDQVRHYFGPDVRDNDQHLWIGYTVFDSNYGDFISLYQYGFSPY